MFAVCAIAKDEPAYYVEEWLDWHRKQGVDKFFIYDNGGWDASLNKRDMEVRSWTDNVQIRAYNHCLRCCDNADYLAFIDLDEFIMGSVLERLPSVKNALILNWKVYGTSGLEWNPYGRQMGVFKCYMPASNTMNSYVKSIVRPKKMTSMIVHNGSCVNNGTQEDFDGKMENYGSFNPINKYPEAWINHYFTRSVEDWRHKAARGHHTTMGKKKYESVFLIDHFCTETEDGVVVDSNLLPYISKASYGTSEKMMDVTDKILSMVKKSRISINPHGYNDFFGDVEFGKRKKLCVSFSRNGVLVGEASSWEDEYFILT